MIIFVYHTCIGLVTFLIKWIVPTFTKHNYNKQHHERNRYHINSNTDHHITIDTNNIPHHVYALTYVLLSSSIWSIFNSYVAIILW